MNIKKLAPWNWFKKEEDEARAAPVAHTGTRDRDGTAHNPVYRLHEEIDRMFASAFGRFGLPALRFDNALISDANGVMLKPTLDVGAIDKAYTVTVEVPGADAKDVHLEVTDDTLTIRGEKQRENVQEGKDFYRIELAYGAFRRVLCLPEDADGDRIEATFDKGVLSITMPRKARPESQARRIEIQAA